MTRILSRLVLGVALLTAPALFVGCAEETKPAGDAPASTPPPAAAPAGAPGDAPKADAPAAPAAPAAK